MRARRARFPSHLGGPDQFPVRAPPRDSKHSVPKRANELTPGELSPKSGGGRIVRESRIKMLSPTPLRSQMEVSYPISALSVIPGQFEKIKTEMDIIQPLLAWGACGAWGAWGARGGRTAVGFGFLLFQICLLV